MFRRFTLRGMFLLITAFGVALWWFFAPIPGISRANCERIKPGMTYEEVEAIVGIRCGKYDGIVDYESHAIEIGKGFAPHWAGLKGEICLELDRNDRVVEAQYYPMRKYTWSLKDVFWERFYWAENFQWTIWERIVLFAVLTSVSTWLLALLVIYPQARNTIIFHSALGFVSGVVVFHAICTYEFYTARGELELALLGPVLSALWGMAIGFVRAGYRLIPLQTNTAGATVTSPAEVRPVASTT